MTAHPPAPGWYPDPSGRPSKSYWDGQKWGSRPPIGKTPIIIGAVVVLVIITIFVVAKSNDKKSARPSTTPTSTAAAYPTHDPRREPGWTPTTPPPSPAAQDEQFIAALGEMKGWPDRAQIIATDRDHLIEIGRDACNMQEQSREGTILTSAWVMDVYAIPGDQASAIVVAAFEVYCPEQRP